jgi:uncharacterized iron-regulated membrane protein
MHHGSTTTKLSPPSRRPSPTLIESISRPDESHFALDVEVSYPDGRSATVYVNPYTGTIQGTAPTFDFKAFTRALHGWWLVPFTNGYSWGWYLVSFLGLPMLASLVTGLVVYKRFWKGFFARPCGFATGRGFSGAISTASAASGRSGSSR